MHLTLPNYPRFTSHFIKDLGWGTWCVSHPLPPVYLRAKGPSGQLPLVLATEPRWSPRTPGSRLLGGTGQTCAERLCVFFSQGMEGVTRQVGGTSTDKRVQKVTLRICSSSCGGRTAGFREAVSGLHSYLKASSVGLRPACCARLAYAATAGSVLGLLP